MKCIGKITIVRAAMKQIIDKKWKFKGNKVRKERRIGVTTECRYARVDVILGNYKRG